MKKSISKKAALLAAIVLFSNVSCVKNKEGKAVADAVTPALKRNLKFLNSTVALNYACFQLGEGYNCQMVDNSLLKLESLPPSGTRVTIDFGAAGTKCKDGITRKGKLIDEIRFILGSTRTHDIRFENYWEDGFAAPITATTVTQQAEASGNVTLKLFSIPGLGSLRSGSGGGEWLEGWDAVNGGSGGLGRIKGTTKVKTDPNDDAIYYEFESLRLGCIGDCQFKPDPSAQEFSFFVATGRSAYVFCSETGNYLQFGANIFEGNNTDGQTSSTLPRALFYSSDASGCKRTASLEDGYVEIDF